MIEIKSEDLGEYGYLEYSELPRGYIKVENDFVQKNMVKIRLPYVGLKLCHYRIADPLRVMFGQIVLKARLFTEWEYIESLQIYNPRHMWYRRNKPLSEHAYGVAFDINPWENQPGTRGKIPMCLVEYIEASGFDWGGRWKYPDPMHFQYNRRV